MKLRVSRARWILLVVSSALCVGALLARRQFPPGRFDGEAEIAALRTEREPLLNGDDRNRDEWRTRAEAARAKAWNEEQVTALETRLGSAWIRSERLAEAGGFLRVAFVRAETPLGEWPAFVRLVGELEREPGLSLREIGLAASGTSPRRFTRMTFTVRFRIAGIGNAQPTASVVPLPVSSPSPSAPRGWAITPPSASGAAAKTNPESKIP